MEIKEKANGVFVKLLFGALVLVAAVTVIACGGKKDGDGDGKEAPASDFSYGLSKDGKGAVIWRYTGKGGKVVIPGEIEGLPVIELTDDSFEGEKLFSSPGFKLTEVVIPASVKKIGDNAFYACRKLTSVIIQGSSVIVGRFAFSHCTKLTSVTIQGSGVTLGNYSFGNCEELSELVFSDGEKTLIPEPKTSDYDVNDAFLGCIKLPLAMQAKLKAMGFDTVQSGVIVYPRGG
jgi:hypothetical protein